MTIRYKIIPVSPEAHLLDVELVVASPDPQGQTFTLPAWIPGSYKIRDFAKNIVTLSAASADGPVQLVKLDKQTWLAPPLKLPLTLRYQVYAWDLSVRTAHLDTTHGFFNGSSVFLRVVGQEKNPVDVVIEPPAGAGYAGWRVATSYPIVSVDRRGFGRYQAADYERLVDHPVEMGDFQELAFSAAGVQHRMTVSGRAEFDKTRLARDLEQICAHHAAFFGELPVEQYLFLVMAVGDGYGGLEHADSTSLLCKRDDLPKSGTEEMTEGYRRFLALCSHEYFHLWNVKRIKPQKLQAADLSTEAYTELLWAFEGITSYYDELALVRCGCIDTRSYLELFARTITRVMQGAGRLKQSIAASSHDAWSKFYQQDENSPNAIVSYYAKGALAAFGLDITLRNQSKESVSLDTLMRELWTRYGKTGIGVPEDGIEKLAAELAGADLDEFFRSTVHGLADLPLEDWFSSLGIGYRLRAAANPEDKGGSCEEPKDMAGKPVLGARWEQQGDFVVFTQVLDNGAAQAAGISAGDRLIAVDDIQVNAANLAERIAGTATDQTLSLVVFRRDELMVFIVKPKPAPLDTCDLWLLADSQCSAEQLARRRQWLEDKH